MTEGLIEIRTLPVEAGTDRALVTRLANLINQVYAVAEQGLWRDNSARTSPGEVATLVKAGEVAVAGRGAELLGSIRVQRLDEHTGELGMLVADPERRGVGVGRELVSYAERRCASAGCTTMQLELLMPLSWSHPVKDFLAAWYQRLGYRVVRRAPATELYPELAPYLATPCDFAVHHKPLVGYNPRPAAVESPNAT